MKERESGYGFYSEAELDNPSKRRARLQLQQAGPIGIMVKDLDLEGSNLDRREVLEELRADGTAVFNRNADRYIWHEHARQSRNASKSRSA